MKKLILPALLASGLALGGCATDPLGSILGSVLGGGYPQTGYPQGGYGNQQFQQAAVNACGAEASRYGRVNVTNVEQVSSSTLRVRGTVDITNGYQQRTFKCDFRNDGRITDFDLN